MVLRIVVLLLADLKIEKLFIRTYIPNVIDNDKPIINNAIDKGLSLFTTGTNNSVFGDPAVGCGKNFIGNFKH